MQKPTGKHIEADSTSAVKAAKNTASEAVGRIRGGADRKAVYREYLRQSRNDIVHYAEKRAAASVKK